MPQGSWQLQHRLAGDADFDEVYHLYMDEASNKYLTYDPMSREAFLPIFHSLLPAKTLFVVLLATEVVATYRLIPKTDRQAHTLYLGGFSIKTSYKGKGIGTAVLDQIRQTAFASGKKRIELTVDIHNEPAIRLYRKSGFETEGTIRKSYAMAGEYYDEYLMAVVAE